MGIRPSVTLHAKAHRPLVPHTNSPHMGETVNEVNFCGRTQKGKHETLAGLYGLLTNPSATSEQPRICIATHALLFIWAESEDSSCRDCNWRPSARAKIRCQVKRIRGNEKESLLYRGRNGLWGQSAGTQFGTKAYDPLHWDNSSLGASDLVALYSFMRLPPPPPLRNRPYGLCRRGYCRIYTVTKAKHP